MTALHLLNALLGALCVIGLLVLRSLHLNRRKCDEAVRQVHAARDALLRECEAHAQRCQDFDAKNAALRNYLDGFAGWLALQQFTDSVMARIAAKKN